MTLYLTAIDPIHLDVGRVLCPPTDPITLASAFTARIIVFDIQVPILAGTSVSDHPPSRSALTQTRIVLLSFFFLCWLFQIELFHHSRDVPAAISKLNATLDRASGVVTKQNPRFVFFSSAPACAHCVVITIMDDNAALPCPRVLTKGASAEVQIAIRQASFGGSGGRSTVIPLEPFSTNKEMGRILIRRGGETIAAGKYTGYGCLLPH